MTKRNHGFTLAETIIAFSILTIVSLLAYIVLSSSTEAARLTEAQAQLQASLRDVMQQIGAEVRPAYSDRSIKPKNPGEVSSIGNDPGDLPVGTISVAIGADGRSIRFQRPQPSNTAPVPQPTSVITIGLQSEDAGFADGDAKLGSGEDVDGDGVLTRRVVRTQDGNTTTLGGVNDVADLQFSLMANADAGDLNLTTLRVRIVASRIVGAKQRLIRADLESRIHLEN